MQGLCRRSGHNFHPIPKKNTFQGCYGYPATLQVKQSTWQMDANMPSIAKLYLHVQIYVWLVVKNHLEKYDFVNGKDYPICYGK